MLIVYVCICSSGFSELPSPDRYAGVGKQIFQPAFSAHAVVWVHFCSFVLVRRHAFVSQRHSSPIGVRRKHQQLPSSLLIENASTWVFGPQGRSFVRRGIPDQG